MSVSHPSVSFDAGQRGQRGSALIMVILLSLIIAAVGGTMIIMSNSEHMISANERDAERALFAARAGLNYAYYQFRQGLILPSGPGTDFNSYASVVSTPLDEGEFSGKIYNLNSGATQGSVYRIESTGNYRRASRTAELVFQIVPEAFKYGYMAFSEAVLHNHSGLAGPTFKIESTILSNGNVGVPDGLTIEGTIVSSGEVKIGSGSTITRDVFANDVDNSGTIDGKVGLLTSVVARPSSAATWDRVDVYGNKYDWFTNNTPGSMSGNAPAGGSSSYTIQDGDEFKKDIFTRNGNLLSDPEVNVTQYVAPPMLDYQAMRAEADLHDPTYFATEAEAVTYLISKKVAETVGGKDVVTVRVGTPDEPEFLYIDDDFQLDISPSNTDDAGSAKIQADAFYLEGGIYITGGFNFDGPDFLSAVPPYPMPPDYYMLSINALPYCYPALLAYEQPGTGLPSEWTAAGTPPMGGGGSINMSGGSEGPSYFNGLVFSQGDIHLHHTSDPREVIRFNGAELGWKLHNCDYFWFSYDPDIRCTRFLLLDAGSPSVVSFREVR